MYNHGKGQNHAAKVSDKTLIPWPTRWGNNAITGPGRSDRIELPAIGGHYTYF